MADPGVEIVEALMAAWNRRDEATILSLSHPNCEYVNAPAAVEPGTRYGHEGLALVLRKQWEGLGEDGRQEIEQVHHQGERIVTVGRVSRSMPGSTTRVENPIVIRWTLRDGLVFRLEILGAGSGFKEALEEAGIEG